MSISFANKFKLIRTAIGKSQQAFADLIDIPLSQYEQFEAGTAQVSSLQLKDICSHQDCARYALWLMTDKTSPISGQIAPGDPSPLQLTELAGADKESFEYKFMAATEEALQIFCQLNWFTPNIDTANFNDCARLLLKDLQALIELHYQIKDES